jgi:hypothetical protein
VRFSNNYGTNSVVINAARVALAPSTPASGNGDIITATDKALTFRGAPGVVIPRGEVVFSDPVKFDLPALTNVAISTYFGNISATTINGHPGSRTTSFIQSGNVFPPRVCRREQDQALVHHHGVGSARRQPSKTIVVLGDSITDGRGSTDDLQQSLAGRARRAAQHQCADGRRGGGQPGHRRQRHLRRTWPGGGESV